jgi:hypothetical protein
MEHLTVLYDSIVLLRNDNRTTLEDIVLLISICIALPRVIFGRSKTLLVKSKA